MSQNQSCCSTLKEEFTLRRILLEGATMKRFYTSAIKKSGFSLALVIFRGIVFLYSLIILTYLFTKAKWKASQLVYYTIWTFILCVLYFGVASTVTLIHYIQDRKNSSKSYQLGVSHEQSTVADQEIGTENNSSVVHPSLRPAAWYMKVQWILLNALVPNAFIVTIIYWGILYKWVQESGKQDGTNITDVSVHALNSTFIIIELVLNYIPVRILHVLHPFVYAFCYVIFSTIRWGINHDYVVYPYIMDWNNPQTTAPALTGMMVFILFIQFGLYGIGQLKMKLTQQPEGSLTA